MSDEIPPGLVDYVEGRFDAKVERVLALRPDDGGGTTAKVDGYGVPVRLWLRDRNGLERQCVFHVARPDGFGHERRSDRALQQLLAWDTFPAQPKHVAALDVGAIRLDGGLSSWADAGEAFLITEWAEGSPYADDLRRIAHGVGRLGELDLQRATALAAHLAQLHRRLPPDRVRWERSLRDTLGSGEGLFGICDAYGDADGPYASPLLELEQLATAARWRLKHRWHRFSRTHGDFHPFNLVFRGGTDFTALDASRGGAGEPADDVTALAINYVFFAIEHRERWPGVFSLLWDAWWRAYLDATRDDELLDCAGLFIAWRAAVVACPRFYPHLSDRARRVMLAFGRDALLAERFDPASAHGVFS